MTTLDTLSAAVTRKFREVDATLEALRTAPLDRPADDIALMVELWQQPRTREVALDLADKNRRAAAASRKDNV